MDLRAHKDILVFASPFFEAALSGDWSETSQAFGSKNGGKNSSNKGRPQSINSVITISQPPSNPGDKTSLDNAAAMTFTTDDAVEADDEREEAKAESDFEEVEGVKSSDESDAELSQKQTAREDSLVKLQGTSTLQVKAGATLANSPPMARSLSSTSSLLKTSLKRATIPADAIIVLKEERACIFHDFLKFVYPQ